MSEFNSETFNEFFSEKIKDKLFESNAFLSTFDNHSEHLVGRTVHLPQYVSTPDIMVDGVSSISGSYGYGFDTVDVQPEDLTYIIQSYRIPTFRVTDFQEALNKPDIMGAIGRNEIAALNDVVAKKMLTKIGSDVVAGNKLTLAGSSFDHTDMLALAQKFDEQNILGERYVILTPQMYYSLLADTAVRNSKDFGLDTLPKGVVNQVAGINIIVKPTVVKTDGSGTVTEGGGTDAALAYVSTSISVAYNSPKVYTQAGVPQLYGNSMSGEVLMGASISRKDGAGVFLYENV